MAIKVPVIVSYDKKGTKQAVSGLASIEQSFKKMGLARKLTLAALTTSIGVFAKKSVAAAVADDKAQKTLNQTLKNLGLSYAALPLTDFIDKLQRATGVSEELLRPAMQKLVRATGDVTKAQDLLNLSLDISASTGRSLEATSSALAKGFLGQNQALGRLGIGLSKAELQSKSFEDISKKLTTLFAGQAGVAANSYAGQLGKLQVAAQEASETIGFALIKSLERLNDEKGIDGAANAMQQLADNTANAILGISRLVDTIKSVPGAGFLMDFIKNPLVIPGVLTKGTIGGVSPNQSVFGMLGQLETNAQANQQALNRRREGFARNQMAGISFNKAQADAAEKARKKALADAQKLLALKKQSAAADKLKAIFDMDIIQLTAAKQGKLSAEELARVNALIAIKTATKVDDLTALNALDAAQKAAADAEIKRQNDILDTHKKNAAEILALNKANATAYADFVKSFTYPGGLFAGTPLAPKAGNATNAVPAPSMAAALPGFDVGSGAAIFGNPGDQPYMPGDAGYSGTAGQTAPAPNVTVNLQGGINIGSTYEFYQSVQAAVQAANTAGNGLTRAGQ
jgi:hypothetical protein